MIVVVGMAFEARIAAGLGVRVICGGDGRNLASTLSRAMAAGCGGLISFGVAGGLVPELKPGTCIIGSSILDDDEERPTDARWAQRLMRILPDAVRGPIAGVREPIAHATAKSALHRETGAIAVDMESHVVARVASEHDVPFAAIRVVVDPVERTIPRSALAGTRPDGTIDPLAVVRSLARYPRDLAGLIRMSLDARAARATLVQGAALLGPGLGLLEASPRRPAIALAGDLTAPVDA
ncbi:MAG: phosphorylase [Alphaproteobacteria bacterium]|nr:MAG: phosphorylase [Alphaproteobacteria bacterium]